MWPLLSLLRPTCEQSVRPSVGVRIDVDCLGFILLFGPPPPSALRRRVMQLGLCGASQGEKQSQVAKRRRSRRPLAPPSCLSEPRTPPPRVTSTAHLFSLPSAVLFGSGVRGGHQLRNDRKATRALSVGVASLLWRFGHRRPRRPPKQ